MPRSMNGQYIVVTDYSSRTTPLFAALTASTWWINQSCDSYKWSCCRRRVQNRCRGGSSRCSWNKLAGSWVVQALRTFWVPALWQYQLLVSETFSCGLVTCSNVWPMQLLSSIDDTPRIVWSATGVAEDPCWHEIRHSRFPRHDWRNHAKFLHRRFHFLTWTTTICVPTEAIHSVSSAEFVR